jgi:hypothetical protein
MNKKYSLICIIGIIGAGALVSTLYIPGIETSNEISNARGPLPMTFVIEADNPLDEINSKSLHCYKMIPKEFDLTHFQTVGNSLGLSEEIEYINHDIEPDTYVIKTEGKALKYHTRTGVWSYSSDAAYPVVTKQPKIPSDEEAQRIAISFLKKTGLWTDDIEFSHISYNYQRKENKITDEIYEEFIISKKVWFEKNIDGIRIDGVGSKCSVTLGENAEVVAFIQSEQFFQKIEENVSIIQPEKALENFKYGRGIRSIPRTNLAYETVTITEISLCYYIDSLKDDPGIITPSFIFQGTFVEGNEFKAYTDAIEKQ